MGFGQFVGPFFLVGLLDDGVLHTRAFRPTGGQKRRRAEADAENQSWASQANRQIATEGSTRLVEDNNGCYLPSHELALILLSFLLAFNEPYFIFPTTHKKNIYIKR